MIRFTQVEEWNICFNLLMEPDVSEIECNGPNGFFMKKKGKRHKIENLPRLSEKSYTEGIQKGLVPFVKSQNEFNPDSFIFEGKLEFKYEDTKVSGRCHIILPPASDYPQVTIAKKTASLLNIEAIASAGSMSTEMLNFLKASINANLTMVLSGQTGAGKALTLDTKIATPQGFTTMGDIKVGDNVFDRFGNTVTVTHKFPQPSRQVYEVEFSTGEKVYCDAEHNWLVSTEKSRKTYLNSTRVEEKRKRQRVFDANIIQLLKEELEKTSVSKVVNISDIEAIIGKKIPQHIIKSYNNIQNTKHKEVLVQLIQYGNTFLYDQREKMDSLYSVQTTQDMMGKLQNKYNIPLVSQPLSYTNDSANKIGLSIDDLPVHPYLLGLWLGDGSSRDPILTALPEDAQAYNTLLNQFGVGKNILKQYNSSDISWKIDVNNISQDLSNLGVKIKHNEHGTKKHIPDIYLYSSVEARKLLLAGLIDTDGWVNGNSTSFTNKNELLIKGFKQLIYSLGYKCSTYKKQKSINGIKHQWFEIRIPSFDCLSLLERKSNRIIDCSILLSNHDLRKNSRTISSIKIVENRSEEMACITVDGPDSTYLITESFIPTHNTTMLEALVKNIPGTYRIGVAEDVPELSLPQENVTYLHSTPWSPGMNPNDVATLDWVVAQFMRNRCDKLIVGETRGKEFAGFLTASNSGMEGSLTTIHAEDPTACLRKMANFTLEARKSVPMRAVNADIANAVDLIIQLVILPGGKHRVSHIQEIVPVLGNSEDAQITTQTLYAYDKAEDKFYKQGLMSDALRQRFLVKGIEISEFLRMDNEKRHPAHMASQSAGISSPEQRSVSGNRGLPTGLPTNFSPGGKRTL